MTSIEANWPFDHVHPDESEAIYDLLVAAGTELDHLDVQIDSLQQQRFLDTATGGELEKLAAEVGVHKETGESKARFRTRARVGKARSRSTGTLPDFAQLLHVLFGDDATECSLSAVTGDPAVRLTVPSVLVDDSPFSASEIESLLEPALPMGDGLVVVTDDTFLLGESGSQGLGEGGLS